MRRGVDASSPTARPAGASAPGTQRRRRKAVNPDLERDAGGDQTIEEADRRAGERQRDPPASERVSRDRACRRIVGRNVVSTLKADILSLQSLNMAVRAAEGNLDGLVHHVDHGSNDLAVVYTDRIEELGVTPSTEVEADYYAGLDTPVGTPSPNLPDRTRNPGRIKPLHDRRT